jgi:uncharacterized protein (TIGR00252 family)
VTSSNSFSSKVSASRFLPSRVDIGARTERAALAYLQARGCQLVARNVRFRVGEIDLIVRDSDDLVFVEVRGRERESLEAAEVALPPAKRLKLWRAIELYLLRLAPVELQAYRAIRIDFLSTNGREWFWYRNIELR